MSLVFSVGQVGFVSAFGSRGGRDELFSGEVVERQFGFGQAAVFTVN